MANKTILVAQREYLENVRTKTFWIGIIAFPVIIAISISAGWILNKLKQQQSYAVLDLSAQKIADRIERAARTPDLLALGKLLKSNEQLPAALQRAKAGMKNTLPINGSNEEANPPEEVLIDLMQVMRELPASDLDTLIASNKGMSTARKYEHQSLQQLGLDTLEPAVQKKRLNELVEKGTLFAFFEIGVAPLTSLGDFNYVSNNLTDGALRDWYGEAATRVVQSLRIKDAKLDPKVAQAIAEQVRFREQKVGKDGDAQDVKSGEKANKYAPFGFVYLLWVAIFTAAQMLLTNTVEEKSNRIIEVLLSSVSPLELMSGKIWGIAATGLTIVGSWVVCTLLGVWLAPRLITGMDFPLMEVIGDPLYLISFVAYFLGGYLLFAAILVGLGSVTNSLKEAQNLLQPVFVLMMVPLVSMFFVVQEPNGTVAKVLSYIPLFTPFTMMNRAGGPPAAYEYVITGLLLLVSVIVAFRLAGKVFRIGVLMTGNPPKLREILGWLRAK